MKIAHEHIIEVFSQIQYYLDGIREAIQMGGTDWADNVVGQTQEVDKLILNFKTSHFPIKENGIPDKKYSYHDVAARLINDPDASRRQNTQNENICLVQEKLYTWIKRLIRERNDLPGGEASERDIYYYVDNIMSEWDQYKLHEKNLLYSMDAVVQDITNEIKQERINNPQQKMF